MRVGFGFDFFYVYSIRCFERFRNSFRKVIVVSVRGVFFRC